MKSIVLQEGSSFRFVSTDDLVTHDALPARVYSVANSPTIGFYLIQSDPLSVPTEKLYGTMQKRADRIMNTYIDRGRSTGVLLAGIKGAGKSLMAKLVANDALKRGWPVICVNESFSGTEFQDFLTKLNTPAVMLMDEFEKVYSDSEKQEALLTLLDGTGDSNKLFLLTVNNKYRVNEHMISRPGRIYYMLEFDALEAEIVDEYLNDKMLNRAHINVAKHLCKAINDLSFDMLAALVEECNRYDIPPDEAIQMLNIKPEFMDNSVFNLSLTFVDDEGKTVTRRKPNRSINVYDDWELVLDEYVGGDYQDFRFDSSHVVSMDQGRVVCRNENATLEMKRVPRSRGLSLMYGY